MKNLHKVATIQRLSRSLGNELVDVEFLGTKIIFHYTDSDTDRVYNDADGGIAEEALRLERLLTITI